MEVRGRIMLTSKEIQEKQFKAGLGFDKKDVEQFLQDLSSDFDELTQENNELKNKIKDLNDSLAYYKSIEKTLQRALILAEKTAQDTRATALREADAIELEAKTKATFILSDSKKQIEVLEHKTLNLMQQYDLFKIHFENMLNAHIELLNSKSFLINTDEFSYKEASQHLMNVSNSLTTDNLHKTFEAISETPNEEKSYQTDDGFEFFTMKDE
jgi:cell division initiation protein